jgi:hypothetical protein
LVKSEGSAEILWLKDSAESVSKQIIEKQGALKSLGLTLFREKDVLIEVLGSPEQTGLVRDVSSYSGWKHWSECDGMYRKRKQSTSDVDVKAIKEVRSQVTEEVTKKVTHDIMVMLHEQGVHFRSPSNTPSLVGGRKSSCASTLDAVDNVQFDGLEVTPDIVDLLTEPTPCTLVINPRGYQMEVTRGWVFPQQSELCSEPVLDGYVVVHIDYVYPEYEERLLSPRPKC